MERPFGCEAGGIAGLHQLIVEHGEAIEVDLLELGVPLTSLVTPAGGLMWRKLRTLVHNLPAGSRTYRALDISGGWTDESHLLAYVIDVLAVANWQRSKDGAKGTNRPKPVRRPGTDATSTAGVTRYGNKKVDRSPEQIRAYLKSIGPQREVVADIPISE